MKAHERRWPATLAVAVIIGLQFAAPDQIEPSWWPVLVVVEALLLVPLVITNPLSLNRDHPVLRGLAVALSVILLGVNAARLVQLFAAMVHHNALTAAELIGSGVLIWSTNVVATAVVLWELDRGGPFARDPRHRRRGEAGRPALPADDRSARVGPEGLATVLCGLSLRRVHDGDRVQPDRHHADDRPAQDPHDGRGVGVTGHHRHRGRPRGQHPLVSGRSSPARSRG